MNFDSRPLLLASVAPRFRRYRVLRTLELAGSHEVVLAVSEGPFGFERTVVIKRLLPGFEVAPAMLRSLARDAMAYAGLTHPAIVRMYDFFAVNSRPAMVLEYIDGRSLRRVLELPTTLPRPAALHVGARVFAALASAHSATDAKTGKPSPVVHRHVCPSTVLITRAGDVKLSDFGFARLVGGTRDGRSGLVAMGYVAPEQARGEEATPRTDLYCASLLVRELLAGRPRFVPGETTHAALLEQMENPRLVPMATACADLPADVAAALDCALAPDPRERTIDAEELQRILRAATDRGQGQRALADALERI